MDERQTSGATCANESRRPSLHFRALLLLMTLAPMGCVSQRGSQTRAPNVVTDRASELLGHSPGAWMVRTELVFGMQRMDGGQVTSSEFQEFVSQDVSPRFPAGYTIVDARGQWRDERGTFHREFSRVLLVIHDGSPDVDHAIEDLRSIYKKRFVQEAVMRIDTVSKVGF